MRQAKLLTFVVLLALAAPSVSFVGAEGQPNCCNASGWQCHTDNDWVDGYYAYIGGECPGYVPQSTPPPDDQSSSGTANSFATPQSDDDEEYPYIQLPPLTFPETPAELAEELEEELRHLETCDCAVEDDILE